MLGLSICRAWETRMDETFADDDLSLFARDGTPPLPEGTTGHVMTQGARIWYADMGQGRPLVLLHGGLGHSGNFAHQVPALIAAGYRVITIDSRGHGRSSRDGQTYSYVLMGKDVLTVMDHLAILCASFVGWSDGACIALLLADNHPDRVEGVVYFACNMDSSGTLPFVGSPLIDHCLSRHRADYAALSPTPDEFTSFADAVSLMQGSQPNYSAADLARISAPVAVLHAERDEFIRREHAVYLAATLPRAWLVELAGVSHFAPLQRPEAFTEVLLQQLGAF